MIEPNFTILLWGILFTLSVNSVFQFILGLMGEERPKCFGLGDVIGGSLGMIIVILAIIL